MAHDPAFERLVKLIETRLDFALSERDREDLRLYIEDNELVLDESDDAETAAAGYVAYRFEGGRKWQPKGTALPARRGSLHRLRRYIDARTRVVRRQPLAVPQVDTALLETTPAVVHHGLTPEGDDTLTILDPDLPPRELARLWARIQRDRRLATEKEKVIYKGGSEKLTENLERWEKRKQQLLQQKRSQSNPRSIGRETEVLGRLAYEVSLEGITIEEKSIYFEKVLDRWHDEAARYGCDPNHYDSLANPVDAIRLALSRLEKALAREGVTSPFR